MSQSLCWSAAWVTLADALFPAYVPDAVQVFELVLCRFDAEKLEVLLCAVPFTVSDSRVTVWLV